jgi:hypothetical protein
VGSGEQALIYLGRSLYRGVIREQDIVACRDVQVSFRFRNAKTGERECRTVMPNTSERSMAGERIILPSNVSVQVALIGR